MPLKSGYSRKTFSANLAELLRNGHERNSAIMAAASMARKSYFKRFPNGALPNWLAFPKAARTVNYYDKGGRPLIGGIQSNPNFITRKIGEKFRQARRAVFPKTKFTADEVAEAMEALQSGVVEEARYAKKNPRAAEPDQHALSKATALYEGFTGKPPRKLHQLDIPALPKAGLAIGKVFGIMYSVDATGERFHHEFKSKAQPLLVVSPDGQQVFLHGGAFTFTKRGFVDH